MPRRRPVLPILRKVSNLLKFSVFIAKMRKPAIPKLVFLIRKARRVKKLKLLKHYNYGFLEEYQFSPSSTPLIHYRRNYHFKNRRPRDIYSMFFLCRCLGSLRAHEEEDADCTLESLPAFPVIKDHDIAVGQLILEPLGSSDEEDTVDLRAERFIRRFYEEMRMQRQESI
ncbi:hypothetical protein I3843_05G214500 [Carya illinoinensis]|nr:hypothetical protein I3843_05G214500 [Carya illinoinensis]